MPDFTYKTFPMLNREMRGIQSPMDSVSSDGEENQKQFITDLTTNLETIKNQEGNIDEDKVQDIVDDSFDAHLGDEGDIYDRDTIDEMFEEFGGWDVKSVQSLPQVPEEHTIYLVQGVVTVQ